MLTSQTLSADHMGSLGDSHEVYEIDGEVFIAPWHNVIDQQGHRIGRWECSRGHWDHYVEFGVWPTFLERKQG